jgi:hypothetical protein
MQPVTPLKLVPQPPAESQEVSQKTLALPDEARALGTINTQAENLRAAELLRRCKTLQAEVDRVFDPIVKTAHAAHKTAVAQKNEVLKPLQEAERIAKALMGDFAHRESVRQREIEDAARRAAQEESDRLALARAAQLERDGRHAEAKLVMDDAEDSVLPVFVAPAAKVEGVSMRDQFQFRIVDVSKLKPEFLLPDEKKIGAIVRSMGRAALSIVGEGAIEVTTTKVVAAKGF